MNERDRLTGLYTRETFCHFAAQKVRENPDKKYDIIISDFVNFKLFNERFGTRMGDVLLARVGEMLENTEMNVICGRYAADRFVLLVEHLDESKLSFLDDLKLPKNILEGLAVDNVRVKFGVYAGVERDESIAVCCDRAHTALQTVKHHYGRNYAVYSDRFGEMIRKEQLIEENMSDALKNHQFEIYYQPKMDTMTEKICGAEAVVRWIHPVYGFMNPGTFIPLFERNGFITKLDKYILENVCKDIREWKEQGLPVVPISMNISRNDFAKKDLSEKIISMVDSYEVEHELLHIEVTESCYAEDPESVVKHIDALHDAGFLIELDDFGTGYTSLSSLNDMTIDVLKIDMSILQKDKPDSSRSVLQFAMQLARMMQLRTIQEGVETKEELERLRELGCDCIQGFYFSKPLPEDDFKTFMIENS